MSMEEVLLSPDGMRKLESELVTLKTVKRKEVAARIKTAREFGDLSENSEYDDAKNEQGFIEARILKLENMLRLARIVTDDEVDPDRIHIGSVVNVREDGSGETIEYVVVGSNESEPSKGRISYQSPVGQALFGRGVGDTVEVRTPGGVMRYEILDVSR